MRSNYGNVVFGHLYRILDGGNAFALQPLHLLCVMNQRTERAHRGAHSERIFDHFHGALDAETKAVFVC
jgi:hypothetical protein